MDLRRARAKLEERRTVLLSRTRRIESDLRETPERDFEEFATETENDEVLERLNEVERSELAGIGAALRRIESGDYGTCTVCGGAIADARLQAVPTTDRCAGCA
jgi:RNA polymerase-binding transcription factor DksA